MRVLFVSHSFPPKDKPLSNVGGMQRVATELYDAFHNLEDVEVIPLVLESSWSMVHYKTPFFLIGAFRKIRQLVKKRQIDTVLFSSMVTALLAPPLKPLLSKHQVSITAIVHGQDVTTPFFLYQRAVAQVFNALDAVFPVSKATGQECLERGLPEDKLHVVPNGIDLSRFSPLDHANEMRMVLRDQFEAGQNVTSDDLILCSVGRQVPRKGFEWFIRNVMPHLPSTTRYWLAGDGPEHESIQEAAAEMELQNQVQLLGRITDEELEMLYRGADLFIMPNIAVPGTMEGFGVVMLEAGACGMPTIASRLEGIQDVITDGVNGHFAESENANSFLSALHPYIEDRKKLQRLSNTALQHTREMFSWRSVAKKYKKALLSVHNQVTQPT